MAPGRSLTGNHGLLPAHDQNGGAPITHIPMPLHSSTTLGFGTVIWRVWPAVLLHTVFAAIIVVISRKTHIHLGVPNVLITLLGVVIGFVISLRVSSGYDRYWWGRCAWSDIVKNSRTMSRLVWIHVPPRIMPSSPPGLAASRSEIGQAMREKHIALELIEAFAVSLKHHLRGELGIYYEDLYHIVRPFHEHHGHIHGTETHTSTLPPKSRNLRAPKHQHSIESTSQLPSENVEPPSHTPPSQQSVTPPSRHHSLPSGDVVVPPINSYGSTTLRHESSRVSLLSSHSSQADGERDPLLPSNLPGPSTGASKDLIPFLSLMTRVGRAINPYYWYRSWRAHWREGFEENDEEGGVGIQWGEGAEGRGHGHGRPRRAARQTHKKGGKHRPRVAGDGENLPLEIIRCMSEWLSVLESRGVVGGNALGGLFSCINSFEDSLATLERILTTPLPYVYSAHISTVWLYLFFMPFQLVDAFSWYTIPGTAVAAFFYLGFLAAGDEIEQPFGYDDNDLDLDLFCREMIRADIHTLTLTPFPNAPIGSHHPDMEINQSCTIVDISLGKHHD